MSKAGVANFEQSRPKWTEDAIERLETLYCVMGWDIDAIAAELRSTPAAVVTQKTLLGLRLTPQAVQERRARGINSRCWTTPIDRDYSGKMKR